MPHSYRGCRRKFIQQESKRNVESHYLSQGVLSLLLDIYQFYSHFEKPNFYAFVLILIDARSTSQTIHKVGTSFAYLRLVIKIQGQI